MYLPDELYQKILESMPIVCVDLVIINEWKEILLVKRRNPPLQNQWWVPGGRVLHGEPREQAARRKLQEECGLDTTKVEELGTYDLILDTTKGYNSHAVSTFYQILLNKTPIRLDPQSIAYDWKNLAEWQKIGLHPFLEQLLTQL